MVKNGVDCIKQYDSLLKGKRLGLITSISGVDRNLASTIDCLNASYHLTALFSPEHGLRGNVEAGGQVDSYTDKYTQVPVYSLYRNDSKRITKEMLDMVDSVVYDIQDVGTRYYTFISTMYYTMQECETYKKELIILDRYNPLGDFVEGNILDENYESFVGAYPICMRYGLTVGELASMMYSEKHFTFPLQIIPVEGWKRKMLFPDTGSIWVMPSLGMPRFETALLYPGTCLFEGTNLSEGRGTSAPFEIIGAPYVDGYKLSKLMNDKKLPGVIFSPFYFTPYCSKYEKEACEGVHIHITNFQQVESVRTGITLLYTIRDCYPENFSFLPPYKEGGRKFIELLFGGSRILDQNVTLEKLLNELEKDSLDFKRKKQSYHKYE